ncbi:hypothetical protein ACGC1H_003174 [Rhizoctonia solani]
MRRGFGLCMRVGTEPRVADLLSLSRFLCPYGRFPRIGLSALPPATYSSYLASPRAITATTAAILVICSLPISTFQLTITPFQPPNRRSSSYCTNAFPKDTRPRFQVAPLSAPADSPREPSGSKTPDTRFQKRLIQAVVTNEKKALVAGMDPPARHLTYSETPSMRLVR